MFVYLFVCCRNNLKVTNNFALSESKNLQQHIFKLRMQMFSGSLQSVVLKLATNDKPQSILKSGSQDIAKSVVQADSLAKQFQLCFGDIIGCTSSAILQIDG